MEEVRIIPAIFADGEVKRILFCFGDVAPAGGVAGAAKLSLMLSLKTPVPTASLAL